MTKKLFRGLSVVSRIAFVSAVIGILFVYVHEKLGVAAAFVVGIALIPGGAWVITRTFRRRDWEKRCRCSPTLKIVSGGSSQGSQSVKEKTSLISREFVQRTGLPLDLASPTFLSGDYESLAPSKKLKDRLGDFAITVGPGTPEEGGLYLAQWDEALGVWWQAEPDDYNQGPRQWAAVRYLDGVEVRRWTTSKTLDSRWNEIIDIVQEALKNAERSSTT